MDKALNHEIQHAIDKESGSMIMGNKGTHSTQGIEQLTKTNEILYDLEKMKRAGRDDEFLMKYLDKQIRQSGKVKTPEAKANKTQLENAKNLFQRYLDEGKRAIA